MTEGGATETVKSLHGLLCGRPRFTRRHFTNALRYSPADQPNRPRGESYFSTNPDPLTSALAGMQLTTRITRSEIASNPERETAMARRSNTLPPRVLRTTHIAPPFTLTKATSHPAGHTITGPPSSSHPQQVSFTSTPPKEAATSYPRRYERRLRPRVPTPYVTR